MLVQQQMLSHIPKLCGCTLPYTEIVIYMVKHNFEKRTPRVATGLQEQKLHKTRNKKNLLDSEMVVVTSYNNI